MTIAEAEKIIVEFGDFYASSQNDVVVLEDGTMTDDYPLVPYFPVWELPYSPATIKYALLFKADHAIRHGYMEQASNEEEWNMPISQLPIGNLLARKYGLLSDFVENAFEINKARLRIAELTDDSKRKKEIMEFEAEYKIKYGVPDHFGPYVEFMGFLADLFNIRRN